MGTIRNNPAWIYMYNARVHHPYMLLTEKVVVLSFFHIINRRLFKKTWENVIFARWEVTSNLFPIHGPNYFLFLDNVKSHIHCSKGKKEIKRRNVRITWFGWINLREIYHGYVEHREKSFSNLNLCWPFSDSKSHAINILFDVALN